jgi:basic membrane protein A
VYADIAKQVIAGTYVPGFDYFDAETGALGLFGFMEGEVMPAGVAELPPEVVAEVKDLVAKSLTGEFNRFDVFMGPINDNAGNEIVPAGSALEQADLDQFPEYGLGCTYCMKWWAEGITAELPSGN